MFDDESRALHAAYLEERAPELCGEERSFPPSELRGVIRFDRHGARLRLKFEAFSEGRRVHRLAGRSPRPEPPASSPGYAVEITVYPLTYDPAAE